MLRLIDDFIDRMHSGVGGSRGEFGPFGSIGSVINVIFCGAMGAFATIQALTGKNVPAFFPLVFVPLELLFIRVALRARRGDFLPRDN